MNICDRISGVPIRIDLDDKPMRDGWISNRNKVIIGPSGSGKSFWTNNMVRQYWEQGCHCLIVDVGDSYEGLCNIINEETNGEDGIYYTYKEDEPISFNPFYEPSYNYSEEKKEQLLTLIKTLWKGDGNITNSEETHLKVAIHNYISKICDDRNIEPSFNSFYLFVINEFSLYLKEHIKVRIENFYLDDLIQVLKPDRKSVV